ncbi:MAG: glycosyltransferase family 39 protein [Cyanobacteria bacterium J06626_18]
MSIGVSNRSARIAPRTVALCLILIALGIVFRFGNLNQVYWHDETFTSLRMSGYTAPEVKTDLFNGETLVTVNDLMQYQWPHEERTVVDTVSSLVVDDPQHPPVYYVLVRQWVAAFGHSIWMARSLSVLISLLSFPAMYWLCQELFVFADVKQRVTTSQRRLTSLLATVLLAVSPYHVLYSQEAREYALWTVFILILNALFLRNLRHSTWFNWLLYTSLLSASLYTHPFTGFFAVGHGFYLLITALSRPARSTIAGCLAVAIGCLSFVPWAWILIRSSFVSIGLSWVNQPLPLDILMKIWGLHLMRCFFLTEGDFGFDTWQVYVGLSLAIPLLVYTLYFICRWTPWRFWLFILTLIIFTCLPLVLPDLIIGGQRSSAGRYFVPTILGMQIAIATVLALHISSKHPLIRQFWRGVTVVILMVAIASNISILRTDATWPKFLSYHIPVIARTVNQSPNPLVISSSFGINYGNVFSLSHQLNPEVPLLLFDLDQVPNASTPSKLTEKFRNVFLLNPSDELRASIEQRENTEADLIFNDFHLYLWKLK